MFIMKDELIVTEFRERAKELVSEMTLDEKVFQTLHSAPAIKHLGIKAYNWWNEALHGVARAGVATVFPQAIGLAATFDEELIEEVADCISTEGRGKFNMQQKYDDLDIYKGLTFWAPNVNIFRDPRWGRGHETFGEDPYLSSRLGVSYVQGLQGHDKRYMKAAACAKHFAVHSGPEADRHSFDAVVSQQDLYETYLPAFKACVQEAKVEAVMGAYNRTNGEPCCGSKTLLLDILRDDWGFQGHVVSDCWAVKDFHMYHHVTSGPVESVAMAMNNGCDLNCGNIFIYLKKAVEDGLVSEERLNEAVTNLYTTKMKLGIFDKTEDVAYNKIGYDQVDTIKSRELNHSVSQKSLVLLKNHDNLLPLDKNKIKSIGIIGPNANSRKALVGNYQGTASRYYTISEGIQDYVGDDVRVYLSEGCDIVGDKISGLAKDNDRISEVKSVCEMSDVVVVGLGLNAGIEGEEGDQGNEYAGGDKPDLRLPGLQEEVLKVAYESGKPVILVLLCGSAMDISWAESHVAAIAQGWYPGAQGGKAIASMLFGEYSPEGKLPVTFYKSTEELPEFKDYSMENRTYRYMKNEALYPFGYGLSYTSFALEDVVVDRNEVSKTLGVQVKGSLSNNGKMSGAETIQVYIKSVVKGAPNYQLKKFKKIRLAPGETSEFVFDLTPKDFGVFDENAKLIVDKGQYMIYVGMNQPDNRSVELTSHRPKCIEITSPEYFELEI